MPVTATPPLVNPLVPRAAAATPFGRALAGPTGLTPTGVQTSQPPTTLQGTASQAGLPANMSTPATAASLGASPDASKMAGTPNALAGALGIGGGAPTPAPASGAAAGGGTTPASLSAGDRTGAFTPRESTDDTARIQKQQQLAQEFGSVGIRVESLVEGAVQAAKPAASAPLYAVSDALNTALSSADPTAAAAVKTAMAALTADPGNQQKFIDAQKALQAAGLDATDPLTTYATASSAAQQAAAGLEHQMFLDPATMQKIGITSQDLTDIGIDPTKAGTTTIAQLRDAIAARQAQAGPVAQEAAAAQSGFAGVGATRALNRDVAGAQSQAGYTSEAAVQQSLQQAQAGETISIGGTNYKIEDLLNSDNFTQLATSYLQAAPDSSLRKQLDSQMPSLSAYINANQTALTAAIGKVSESTAGVKSAEAANTQLAQQLATTLGMTVDQVRKTFGDSVPGLGDQFTSTKADPSKNGVLSAAMNPSLWSADVNPTGASPVQLATAVQALQKSDPAAYAAVSGMTPAQLAATGILGRTDDEKAKFAQLQQQAADVAAHKNDTPQQKMQFLFGTANPSEVVSNLQAAALLETDPAKKKQLQDVADGIGKPGQLVGTGDVSGLMPTGSLTSLLNDAAAGKAGWTSPGNIGYSAPVSGSIAAAVSSALASIGSTRLSTNPQMAAKLAADTDSVELAAAIPQLSNGDPAVAGALQNAVDQKRVGYTGSQAATLAGLDNIPNGAPTVALGNFLTSGSPETLTNVVTSPAAATAAQQAISALQRVASDPHAYPDNANWKIGILQQQLDAFNRQQASNSAPAQPKQKTKLEKLLGQ